MQTIDTPVYAAPTSFPIAPATLEESGLSLDLLLQLALKTLHFSGDLTGSELAHRLGLNFSVIETAVDFLKSHHQVEIVGVGLMCRAAYRDHIAEAGIAAAGI